MFFLERFLNWWRVLAILKYFQSTFYYFVLFSLSLSVNFIVKQKCRVDLPGGPLEIEWREEDNHVYMTGPAEVVFYGSLSL